ncbi:MAG: winged helix-turn-helix domain-containing protein [Euryarchaeota archaeon]|nr:winged helix-turn-helix domain-containing protein [Euryarchaeota archaeon]
MSKVTLDRETFKALASDTRLDILKSLDGKNMSLKDICTVTNLNKATLHEHLVKLNGAGLIKKNERDGHKWVYYKLTWKGECLLHPENTRIVVLFTTTFIALLVGIAQFMQYVKGTVTTLGHNILTVGNGAILTEGSDAMKFVALDRSEVAIHLPSGAPDLLSTLMEKKSLAYNFSLARISNEGTDTISKNTHGLTDKSEGISQAIYQDPTLLYIAIACFVVFTIVLCISFWRIRENKKQKI